MTIGGSATPARFEIANVISRMFTVIGANFGTFLGLSALLSLPYLLFTSYAVLATALGIRNLGAGAGAPGATPTLIGGIVAGVLIYFLFTNLLQAALTHGTIVALNGGRASFGDCFSTGLRNVLPVTGITVLATLGMMAGFVLLIVPGVILALMWSVLIPVRVAEETSVMDTFGRSFELTRGYKGSIFGLMIIFFVCSIVLSLFVRPLSGLSFLATRGETIPVIFVVIDGVVRIVTGLIVATGVASIYYELRQVKEGAEPEQIAAVFA